jgi:hypothetical protein
MAFQRGGEVTVMGDIYSTCIGQVPRENSMVVGFFNENNPFKAINLAPALRPVLTLQELWTDQEGTDYAWRLNAGKSFVRRTRPCLPLGSKLTLSHLRKIVIKVLRGIPPHAMLRKWY